MNVVEASNYLREELDAYGRNFSIRFDPKSDVGIFYSGLTTPNLQRWELHQSGLLCELSFERMINNRPAQVYLRYTGQAPEPIVREMIDDVRSKFKPLTAMPAGVEK
jgi:hypothetical protein